MGAIHSIAATYQPIWNGGYATTQTPPHQPTHIGAPPVATPIAITPVNPSSSSGEAIPQYQLSPGWNMYRGGWSGESAGVGNEIDSAFANQGHYYGYSAQPTQTADPAYGFTPSQSRYQTSG